MKRMTGIFNRCEDFEPTTLEFLEAYGFVFMVRSSDRKTGYGCIMKDGKTLFRVLVSKEADYNGNDAILGNYVKYSGFPSVQEWKKAIEQRHGANLKGLAVFCVERFGESGIVRARK